LIVEERLSISDAAYEGGYADHAHLTRAFQRFGGFAPSAIPEDLVRPSVFQAAGLKRLATQVRFLQDGRVSRR